MSFEKQNLPNGQSNPKYVDVLDEDKAISGQKFVCVSFLSPDKILTEKSHFMFQEFMKFYEFKQNLTMYQQFMQFLAYKHNLKFDSLMTDFEDFVKDNRETILNGTSIGDEYKTFLDEREEELEKEFSKAHNFQTSVRGLKVRGSFSSQEEAELRCKMLREVDPNHDIFVGPVGVWMPWEPEAYKTGKVEYIQDELNQLMHEKIKNESKAQQEFEARVRESKEKAIAENKKIAERENITLTQDIDADGNLVSVGKNTVTDSLAAKEEVSSADIRKELFEGDNIVMGKERNTNTNN
jgi:hypothetical protein